MVEYSPHTMNIREIQIMTLDGGLVYSRAMACDTIKINNIHLRRFKISNFLHVYS